MTSYVWSSGEENAILGREDHFSASIMLCNNLKKKLTFLFGQWVICKCSLYNGFVLLLISSYNYQSLVMNFNYGAGACKICIIVFDYLLKIVCVFLVCESCLQWDTVGPGWTAMQAVGAISFLYRQSLLSKSPDVSCLPAIHLILFPLEDLLVLMVAFFILYELLS